MHGGDSDMPVSDEQLAEYIDKLAVDSEKISHHDSLLKDGRRFVVGDCALFQAGKSPPFIGIIRWFSPDKRDNLKLGVSRLFRPSEVKLAKGILLESAPNEVFYSFQKDEISAELLLHPCKVAFLRKGVELPQWVSSFVCRRVYDSANKCLWWLTDQDYIDDQQDEVAKLLSRTREEMHAAVQSGGRSPKQSKSGTDNLQNSTISSFTSPLKGKKRAEKADLVSDSNNKRERPSKLAIDGVSLLKAEIEKITEKGAVANIDSVDKLVQLLQADKVERKIDLPGRKLLADIIASIDKNDCLMRFVQLKGMSLLDDWLQEMHKGKNGGDGDKAADELLLALLHALDKLPVNLEVLRGCNVGKSVNHLRSHKNSEIQKKARGLVDAWKKQIDVEMALANEAKTTNSINQGVSSLTGKPGLPEGSQAGGKQVSGPGEAPPKVFSSVCKSSGGKSNSLMSASVKHMGSKELQPVVAATEEKSSSSSQSCSSDHGKSPTSGPVLPNKVTGSSIRLRKSSNGHLSSAPQKDGGLTKSSPLSRNAQIDKNLQHGQPGGERDCDDHGSNQRVVVRLPNPGRSPARSFLEESASQSAVWSTKKIDSGDHRKKTKIETFADTCQTDDVEGTAYPLLDVKPGKGSEFKPRKTFEASLAPMNALAESCAKYSEASTLPIGDDSGMNLLASVATGEMSKLSTISPSGSPMRPSPTEEVSAGKANVSDYPVNRPDDASEKYIPKFSPNTSENSQDLVSRSENKDTVCNVMDSEEVKGASTDDYLSGPQRRRVSVSSDSKKKAEPPKSDESEDRKKSDGVVGCSVEAASSNPVERVLVACLTNGVSEVLHGAKQEESKPDVSISETLEVSKAETETVKRINDDRDHEKAADLLTKDEKSNVEQSPPRENFTLQAPIEASGKLDFDLNEGLSIDEGSTADPTPSARLPNLLNFGISQASSSSPAPVTVAAPAKGPFVPPETLLKSKGEPGWRGSAATSAFRPAEPRKIIDPQSSPAIVSDSLSTGKPKPRGYLDIDLNVADERTAEESSPRVKTKNLAGLNLDLNQADESTDRHKPRNFDLNNGPIVDETPVIGNNLPFLPSLRLNNGEIGGLASWFPPGNSYPAIAIPSFLPERVDQPQPYPVVGPAISPYRGDIYRGPVLSSSPAMTFSPGAAGFSYAGFPFGSSFPLASTSSYAYPDPMPGGYARPYVIGIHDGSGGVPESGRKWGHPNLDLNSGSAGGEIEGRVTRNVGDDQARLYQGRAMKRKDPDGGWDSERFPCK